MTKGVVVAIFIAPQAGAPMQEVDEAMALKGQGLEGDRYGTGEGSWNKGEAGKRQVSLINSLFFLGTPFTHAESRRSLITSGIELMWLINREFRVGEAVMRGVKYCDPCERPSRLAGKQDFSTYFFDRGGLIADVIQSGRIYRSSSIIPPPRKHSPA